MFAKYSEDELYKRYTCLEECKAEIDKILAMMLETYKNKGKILLCGNGGSCADCDHIVGELMKSFMQKRACSQQLRKSLEAEFGPEAQNVADSLQSGIPAINLASQTGVFTAYINDVVPEYVYAQLLYGYANEKLFCLSTSGNSKNVVNAVKVARALGIKSCAITGKNESLLSALCDVCVRVPETETYKVQELTLPVYHHLCALLEIKLFGEE